MLPVMKDFFYYFIIFYFNTKFVQFAYLSCLLVLFKDR